MGFFAARLACNTAYTTRLQVELSVLGSLSKFFGICSGFIVIFSKCRTSVYEIVVLLVYSMRLF